VVCQLTVEGIDTGYRSFDRGFSIVDGEFVMGIAVTMYYRLIVSETGLEGIGGSLIREIRVELDVVLIEGVAGDPGTNLTTVS
jgi:hypothetical protein